jgi:predicted nucleic acid-binding protein
MSSAAVFVDTSALMALLNRDDAKHGAAVAVRDQLAASHTSMILSDWVLSELLASCSRQPLRAVATRTARILRTSASAHVVEATRQAWDAAFELYGARQDKEWSLVDCTSVLICEELGIRRMFAHDRHFSQAGLEILLP